MQVQTAHAPATTLHAGHRYYFCSDRCHDTFVREPGRYSQHGAVPAGMAGEAVDRVCGVAVKSAEAAATRTVGDPKRTKNRSCLPPTWTLEELGERSGIERFFGRVFLFFRLQRLPLTGWSTIAHCVALTYASVVIVALAATDAGCPDLIRSPKRVLAHTWEGLA